MQNQNETMQSPSLARVIMNKVVNHVETHKANQLLKQLTELAAGLILGALIVAPAQILNFINSVAKIEDYAPPKLLLFGILFFGRKSIFRIVKRIARFFQTRKAELNDEKLLDNIPVAELVDYMLRNKHFKREGVNGVRSTFGLNMEKFNALANKLEENKVLVRGENNGRIVDGKWSRQALIDYLSGKNRSVDLQPRFTIHRIGGGKVRLMKDQFQPALQD